MRVPLRILALLVVLCGCNRSVDPAPVVTLSTGTFWLKWVDHAPIPRRIARAAGDSSDVFDGILVLNATTGRLSFTLYWTRLDGRDVGESLSMPLRVVAPDSFGAGYWRGRAWRDTAEVLTTGAPFGTHLMRLVRTDGP